MLKLQVSGKPKPLQMLKSPTPNGCTAYFILEETRFSGGQRYVVTWEVYVPPHKVKWCSTITAKPYTVVVEADEFHVLNDTGDNKSVSRYMMRLTELHSL